MLTRPFDSVKTPACHKARTRRRRTNPAPGRKRPFSGGGGAIASRPSVESGGVMPPLFCENAAPVVLAPRSLTALTSLPIWHVHAAVLPHSAAVLPHSYATRILNSL